jgi:hypothetical protein
VPSNAGKPRRRLANVSAERQRKPLRAGLRRRKKTNTMEIWHNKNKKKM